jgi:hypothetical protein
MWEELGIVPTADPKAIRRAYAGRLRGLDPDQDPAGFQRLRQAFEAALSQAEQPARAAPQRARELRPTPPTPKSDTDPTPPPQVIAPSHRSTSEGNRSPLIDDNRRPSVVDDAQWRAVFHACRRSLVAGDVEAAFGRLMDGWAQGLIPIAEEDDIVAQVMAAAVDDRTLSGERFQFMARHLDWDRPITVHTDTNVALRESVLLRLDAETWYAALRDNATRRDRWPTFVDQQERWLARVLLGMAPRWWLALVHSSLIRWRLKPYDAFEPWLQDRIDPRRLTQLKETSRSGARDAGASLYWLWHIIVSGLAIFGLMFGTRFGCSSSPIREENPSSLAWWRRVKQQAELRGIPLGVTALWPVLLLTMQISVFALGLVLVILAIALAIFIPPLGAAIVIANFLIRRARKKRKNVNTMPGD